MKNEEKQLLLKDLCARLPYGVKISTRIVGNTSFIDSELSGELLDDFIKKEWDEIKPYLRPMSSMTEVEEKEYYKTFFYSDRYEHEHQINGQITFETYDWLNKHHFDYRHLISLGLALEAPEGMYN